MRIYNENYETLMLQYLLTMNIIETNSSLIKFSKLDSMETLKEIYSSIDFKDELCISRIEDNRFILNFSEVIENISSFQNCGIEIQMNAYHKEDEISENHQYKEIHHEVDDKISLNYFIQYQNLSLNDGSDSLICITPIYDQNVNSNQSQCMTNLIVSDNNLNSLNQEQNKSSNIPNSSCNQILDELKNQKIDLSERKDVVNRAILRGIKKFYINLLLNFIPEYKNKRLCRVHKPTLLKDIINLCKRFKDGDELPKAVFCLIRPNSIDFVTKSESYKEDVLVFIDCIQRYSHKKFNSITKLEFVKVLFSHIYDCEKTLDSFIQVNSLMSKHLETYIKGIKRFGSLLSKAE